MKQRLTVPEILSLYRQQEKIVAITSYDFPFAVISDRAGVHILLVGDSVGTVVQGNADTLSVTIDEICYHSRIVVRSTEHALVVGDMPFMSYQPSSADALRAAGRLVKEAGVQAVKLEGGREIAPTIAALVAAGIPVMGHVGLLPQHFHQMGGYRVQGKSSAAAAKIKDDALAIAEAGAFALVLEGIPAALGAEITQLLSIPTIGIGAGAQCSGQILVIHDALGLSGNSVPKFVKRYAELGKIAEQAIEEYVADVKSGSFPSDDHSY